MTITAGTAKASPATTSLPFDDGIVRRVDVRVPSGPAGLMGFLISYADSPVIPSNSGIYLVMDDEQWPFDVDNHPTGGQWQLIGYNTDVYDHTVYLRFHIDEIPKPLTSSTVIQPVPLGG